MQRVLNSNSDSSGVQKLIKDFNHVNINPD